MKRIVVDSMALFQWFPGGVEVQISHFIRLCTYSAFVPTDSLAFARLFHSSDAARMLGSTSIWL